jgi:hypothetical protein
VSKILATGNVASNFHKSPGMSRSAATSLIERNKTLVKEVRFADQTCVELSERNSSLKREVKRLEHTIDDLKQENKELHEGVVRSVQFGAKMEEERDNIDVRMEEQTFAMKKEIQNLKTQHELAEKKLVDGNSLNITTEKELVAVRAKYDALKEEHIDAKEKVTMLIERLNTSQTTSNIAATSATESYRELYNNMEMRFQKLQEEKDSLVIDRDEWKHKYNEKTTSMKTYEGVPVTPKKEIAQGPTRTPTSTILAKTLQSELAKGHDISERILEAEKIISFTQSKLQDTATQLKSSQVEVLKLRKELNQQEGSNDRRTSATEDFQCSSHVDGPASKELIRVLTECDEKKREMEHRITQILTQNDERLSSNVLPSSTHSLLIIFQQFIRASTRVKKTDMDIIALYANQLISQKLLTPVHSIHNEDTSEIPVTPLSLRLMEEGSLSVPSGDEEVKREFKTPFKVLYINGKGENVSPVDYKAPEQTHDISRIPHRFSDNCDERILMKQQLEAANDEQIALSELLDTMREHISKLNVDSNKEEDTEDISLSMNESNLRMKEEEFEETAVELNFQLELLQNQIHDLEEENKQLIHQVEEVTEENKLFAREALLSTTPLTSKRDVHDAYLLDALREKCHDLEEKNHEHQQIQKHDHHIIEELKSSLRQTMEQMEGIKTSNLTSSEKLSLEVERNTDQCKKYDELRVQTDCFEMELEVKESALKEAENKILSASNQVLRLKEYISSLEEEVDRLRNKNESILSLHRDSDDKRLAERNLREEIEYSLKDLLMQKESKEHTIMDLQSELKSLSHEHDKVNAERKEEFKIAKDLRIKV